MLARRSTDRGDTWSDPVVIAEADPARLVFATAALAPDGETVYVVWPSSDLTGASTTLMYSKSTDGGLTWCADTDPPCPGPIGDPIVGGPPLIGGFAVSADGTLGVTFYDHRSDDDPDDSVSTTDLWIRHSHDGGSRWSDDHVAGPFDQVSAPGGHIGDYQGMVPIEDGFAATFVLAEPLAEHGKTDVFSRGFPWGDWSRAESEDVIRSTRR